MRRILVVDDEHLVADTLRIIFHKHGFDARAVYSVDDAMVCVRSFIPDLVLCDISMPGRDGVELLHAINHALPECRMLVLTGNYANLKRVREQSLKLKRPANILTKPCQPSDLLREAGELLASA